MNLLSTHSLSIGYSSSGGQITRLHQNVNVSLQRGEFACLLGPNGAGKSTLIRTLAGFLKQVGGEVFFENELLEDVSAKRMALKVSVVLTEKLLIPNMSVFDLVALGRTPYTGFFGRLSGKDKEIVLRSLEDIGMAGFAERQMVELSDGERQKVMVAKALAQDTPLIILDEPTAFLDLPSRIEMMQLLRKLAREKDRAILLSSHDLDLALQMADKVWLMAKDMAIETGTPEDLILNNEFKRFFEREGVVFNNDTGAFSAETPSAKVIRLIGKGAAFRWVGRALVRNGFSITHADIADLPLEVNVNGTHEYVLQRSTGERYALRTIEDLLAKIRFVEELENI